MKDDSITMSEKQLTRYSVIKKLIDKNCTVAEAAVQIDLSERQVIRLKKAVLENGAIALIHGNKGRKSNRSISQDTKDKAINIIKEKYSDFGPTLAMEKLRDNHSIVLSKETLRSFMSDAGVWKIKPRKGAVKFRMKRKRKEHYGEMIQFDGSYHHWFEGREGTGEDCLLVAIDDATGKLVKIEFKDGEGKNDVFAFWIDYAKEHGAPKSVYIDRFSTYKINNPSVADLNVKTQFEKAMTELGVTTISAHSPQAKGRVERVNQTLQDRLVKELRLLGISDRETANRYLKEVFVPEFNRKFGVRPDKCGDVHRLLTEAEQKRLPHIFATKVNRTVCNDFTISYKTRIYQLTKEQTVTICRKDTVVVEEHLDGSIHLLHQKRNRYLSFHEVSERPKREKRQTVLPANRKVHKPAANHPWRRPMKLPRSGAPTLTTR